MGFRRPSVRIAPPRPLVLHERRPGVILPTALEGCSPLLGVDMPTYRDMLRARMEAAKGRANESRETLRRTGGQAASPTTFADCADLFWRAAVAYGTASELYTLGETVAGD